MLGHYGNARAWVNGERVFSKFGRHGGRMEPDRDKAHARLRKGWNRVLVKLVGPSRQFQAQFRIVGLDRQPIRGLQFAATADR